MMAAMACNCARGGAVCRGRAAAWPFEGLQLESTATYESRLQRLRSQQQQRTSGTTGGCEGACLSVPGLSAAAAAAQRDWNAYDDSPGSLTREVRAFTLLLLLRYLPYGATACCNLAQRRGCSGGVSQGGASSSNCGCASSYCRKTWTPPSQGRNPSARRGWAP